eukprot:5202087-Pleurochrysis_carterae.AAC.1
MQLSLSADLLKRHQTCWLIRSKRHNAASSTYLEAALHGAVGLKVQNNVRDPDRAVPVAVAALMLVSAKLAQLRVLSWQTFAPRTDD